MELLISSILIIIILGVIFFLLTKKILKAIGFTIILVLLFSFASGILIYKDVLDIQQNFETGQKLFLLNHNNTYITGLKIVDMEELNLDAILNQQEINNMVGKSNSEILGNNYKLFIFNSKTFQDIQSISFWEMEFTKQEIFSLLESPTPINNIITKIIEKENYPETMRQSLTQEFKSALEISDNSQMKGILFMLLLEEKTNQNEKMIFNELRDNNLTIYPETIIFKIIKVVPDPILKKIESYMEIM